jgi:hypothetical protein
MDTSRMQLLKELKEWDLRVKVLTEQVNKRQFYFYSEQQMINLLKHAVSRQIAVCNQLNGE